jgi:hypothetical protein
VAYYESLGFAVSGQIKVPGGGPAHWAMCASPRRETSLSSLRSKESSAPRVWGLAQLAPEISDRLRRSPGNATNPTCGCFDGQTPTI